MNITGLLATLQEANQSEIVRVTPLTEDRAVFTINLNGDSIQATVRVEEYLGKLTKVALQKTDRAKLKNASKGSKSSWSEKELREEGLPLYWSKEWLEAALNEHGNYKGIEEAYGYAARTVNNYAANYHGIQLKPRKKDKPEPSQARAPKGEVKHRDKVRTKSARHRVIDDYLKTGGELQDIADKHNVSLEDAERYTLPFRKKR